MNGFEMIISAVIGITTALIVYYLRGLIDIRRNKKLEEELRYKKEKTPALR